MTVVKPGGGPYAQQQLFPVQDNLTEPNCGLNSEFF